MKEEICIVNLELAELKTEMTIYKFRNDRYFDIRREDFAAFRHYYANDKNYDEE